MINYLERFFILLIFISTLSIVTCGQSDKYKDTSSFNEQFENIPVDTFRIESKPFDEISITPLNQSQKFDPNLLNAICFIMLLGLVIVFLGAISTVKKTTIIRVIANICYRFSPRYKNEKFIKKVNTLKQLLDQGIISQSVYDSRLKDLLKDNKL